MYKIIKDGLTIGQTEYPNLIKMQDNGCFGLVDESEAQGIVWNSVVYHLVGQTEIEGAETVVLDKVDSGIELTKTIDAAGIAFVTLAETGGIDPITAGEHIDLFAKWTEPVSYLKDQIRRYNGKLYRCISAHTSQADWTPDTAVSLWVNISDPAEEWPPWSQPVGAHDAYSAGAKVSHKDKHWTSTVDANVWEPGVYGWTEVVE